MAILSSVCAFSLYQKLQHCMHKSTQTFLVFGLLVGMWTCQPCCFSVRLENVVIWKVVLACLLFKAVYIQLTIWFVFCATVLVTRPIIFASDLPTVSSQRLCDIQPVGCMETCSLPIDCLILGCGYYFSSLISTNFKLHCTSLIVNCDFSPAQKMTWRLRRVYVSAIAFWCRDVFYFNLFCDPTRSTRLNQFFLTNYQFQSHQLMFFYSTFSR